MGLTVFFCCLSVLVFALLFGGVNDKPTWRLILAWVIGVFALYTLAALVSFNALPTWEDRSAESWEHRVSWPHRFLAMITILLSIMYALFLRRRVVLYLALVSLPFLAWPWSFAFRAFI